MPEFEIRRWTLSDLSVLDGCQWLEQCLELKRWAFASDYLRLEILDRFGGIYLDSDVCVVRSLLPLLGYSFFSAVEFHPSIYSAGCGDSMIGGGGVRLEKGQWKSPPGIGMQAAFLGAVPSNALIREIKSFYKESSYLMQGGVKNEDEIAPGIYALKAEKFGFTWRDRLQLIGENAVVLPTSCVGGTPQQVGRSTLAFHCCANSWR